MSLKQFVKSKETPKKEKKEKEPKEKDPLKNKTKIAELEREIEALETDNAQMLAECYNAILYLESLGITDEKILEKIFPFTRLFLDEETLMQLRGIQFPLVFKEEDRFRDENEI